jgi:hypothetical protein
MDQKSKDDQEDGCCGCCGFCSISLFVFCFAFVVAFLPHRQPSTKKNPNTKRTPREGEEMNVPLARIREIEEGTRRGMERVGLEKSREVLVKGPLSLMAQLSLSLSRVSSLHSLLSLHSCPLPSTVSPPSLSFLFPTDPRRRERRKREREGEGRGWRGWTGGWGEGWEKVISQR